MNVNPIKGRFHTIKMCAHSHHITFFNILLSPSINSWNALMTEYSPRRSDVDFISNDISTLFHIKET